ncbi:MAG: PAS domain-containing protein [Bacteroidota bacterium]
MKEMYNYDLAAQKYYADRTFKALPLEAWDLFAERYNKFCKGLEEIQALQHLAKRQNWSDTSFFEKEILQKDHIVVVTDPQLHIVHASQNIYQMNGYHPSEIIGQTPKIFQGEGTNKATLAKIRTAITEQRSFEATLVNYRKDGSPYKCWIKGNPVKDAVGQVVNFVAFEREVA